MKKLDKTQQTKKDDIAKRLREKAAEATQAQVILAEKVTEYNKVVKEAEEYRGEIVQAMEEYAADRSENWPESESGQTFEEWKGQWEEEFSEVDEPETIEFDHADKLDDMPAES